MTDSSETIAATVSVPAWAWMWLLAGCIFAGAKWLTWRTSASRLSGSASVIYWLGWPGLDASPFENRLSEKQFASWKEWVFALSKFGLGLFLVRFATDDFMIERPMAGGAVGFAGILFCLHFGLFHLLALVWNAFGYRVQPIMQAPVLSESLAEFWGRRWNRAFAEMAQQVLVRPCRTVLDRRGLLLVVFGVSGLLHEAVISIPARGGYGGPTAYFAIQAVGIAIQRSRLVRRCGCHRGFRGWLVTALFVLSPLPLLFHPPFLTNVIAPFVRFSGSLM
jgi:alginate O-acetyltransferase complex protein AlgI